MKASQQNPVVTLTGPRQSGKTTLLRAAFPNHHYLNLELPSERELCRVDPQGVLRQYSKGLILDEVQHLPEMLSYIQAHVDAHKEPGKILLSGSQNLLLLERVSQSLAGRTALLHLLPFSLAELESRTAMPLEEIGLEVPPPVNGPPANLMETLLRGFYPRIHDLRLDPAPWLDDYIGTYVERDVRTLLNVGELDTFHRFLALCAGRVGQLLNVSALGADCGVSHTTAQRWLSFLQASYVIHLLRPYHANFGKRFVKSPKLYFVDTGVLCTLLRIRTTEHLWSHPARGSIFENYVVMEALKSFYHQRLRPDMYFWRDMKGNEVDLILDLGDELVPVEVKSSATPSSSFFDGLEKWAQLSGRAPRRAAVVYAGDVSRVHQNVALYGWNHWL